MRVPQGFIPKEISEFSDSDKESVALDTNLQLIIVESMDSDMCHQICELFYCKAHVGYN